MLPSALEDNKAEIRQQADAWFASLPEAELTHEESSLRRAILDFISDFKRSHGLTHWYSSPTLRDVLQDEGVQASRDAFFPRIASFLTWINGRMFDDVEMFPDA